MTHLWRSLSFRLALTYAGVLCLSMLTLFGIYYGLAVLRPMETIRAQVDREAQLLTQLYIVDGESALIAALDQRARHDSARRAFHTFITADGKVATTNLPSWPSRPVAGMFSIEADTYAEGDEQDFSARARDHRFRDGARLIVGRDAEDIEDREEVLFIAAPWIMGLTLLFGLVGGIVMNRAIGARIEAVSGMARRVMAGALGERVPVRGTGDDFDRLAETLNLMLQRNEDLFESVRRVSDNVAHELRTPLARLRVQLERLDTFDDDPDTRSVVREAALEETMRLQRIFDALLRIARIEEGRHAADMRCTDIAQLAADAAELYQPAASARHIALRVDTGKALSAIVDPDLIFQALTNLLDNALKHSQPGGEVTLSVETMANTACIRVRDTGTGLAQGEADRITERFFRGKAAENLPGQGLGLSLVAAIVALHKGQLSFEDAAPGLSVTLRLPLTHD